MTESSRITDGIYHAPAEATELPIELRHNEEVTSIVLRGSKVTALPEWLRDMPVLRAVDADEVRLTSLPKLPRVTIQLCAQTLWEKRSHILLDQVYSVAVNPTTTLEAIQHLFNLARRGSLNLRAFRIIDRIPFGDREDQTEWTRAEELNRGLDDFLAASPRIRFMTFQGSPFRRLPESMAGMKNLESFQAFRVELDHVPDWLFDLPELDSLALGLNGLSDLPPSLGRARKLKHLNLTGNPMRRIPEAVWELAALESLDLSYCQVEVIPPEILRLTALKSVVFENVTMTVLTPPVEVTSRGLEAIKSYWRQEQQSGMDYLAEAKLLIVGEPGAGKTSLAKKILDASYRLDPDEGSTEGIGVFAWTFPTGLRVGERFVQRDFNVNIWDFGGQEIYHATHQFFLTKRSLYVLVTDERKEDTDFQYWLGVVNLLSGGSPLIIVQNRKQGRGSPLDLRTLRQDYPNLVGTIGVDLSDNSGLDEVLVKMRRELELLPHIGTALPRTWQDVRVALESDPRNHISAEEFFRVCAANGFADEADMRQLGGYLHDLGVCLFFQDDPLLSKTVILKPEWGTGAVYRVLDDEPIIAERGVFGPADLRRIWHEPSYASMRGELLQLMAKFSLCFTVPGTTTYVAPQLLSPVRPDYVWDEPGLALRYEYEVMPKGIVRRLIVALHDMIDNHVVWRSGVVLRHDDTWAEVIEDYHRRRLTLRLAGRDPRVLLALIDRALNEIHRSYPEIGFNRFRQCDCEVCTGAKDPTMFPVSELESFARTRDGIQCRASRRLMNAAVLLRELWKPADPNSEEDRVTGPAEVFVSYKWGGAADQLVDEVQANLGARGLVIKRDRNELRYRESIQRFMRWLGASKIIVVVLDDAYIKSRNCMFELTEIADRPDFAQYVFPVVLGDADIFDALGRLRYVRYWENKRDELAAEMGTVGPENLQGIREELDLYEKIRNTVAGITGVLADMNTLTPEVHRGDDFGVLFDAIDAALSRHTRTNPS